MTPCPICHNTHSDECSRAALLARIDADDAMIADLTGHVASAEGERDDARRLLDDVMTVLRWSTERDNIRDPLYEHIVETNCAGVGYGALMDSAQRCWRRSAERRGDPVGGEHIAGPCRGTVDAWLRAYESMPGAAAPRGHGARGVVVVVSSTDTCPHGRSAEFACRECDRGTVGGAS